MGKELLQVDILSRSGGLGAGFRTNDFYGSCLGMAFIRQGASINGDSPRCITGLDLDLRFRIT